MAEKPEEKFSMEDKLAKAKELYAIGCRNFYVKSYSEAADDLSEASKLFGEVHGVDGDELGEVYLMYAKALIAIGQEENKLIEVPEEDDDDDDEPVEEDDGESNEAEAIDGKNLKLF
jgi:nuclear autoantigenic sperm protein